MADDIMRSEDYTPQLGGMSTKGTQKILNMLFIVDISGSMKGEGRIQAVNQAFTRMVPALRQLQTDSMSEFELRIGIMTFDETARWIVAPTPILEYDHQEIECSRWVTYYSRAFQTLGEKLTRSEYMAHTGKIAQPYIMFMTDGEPTADDDYQPELDKLLENGWFKASQRFAVLIGQDTVNSPAARAAVERFVTSPAEGIINAVDAEAIVAEVQAKTIHTIAVQTKHAVGETPVSPDADQSGAGGQSDDFNGFGGFDDFDDIFDNDTFI